MGSPQPLLPQPGKNYLQVRVGSVRAGSVHEHLPSGLSWFQPAVVGLSEDVDPSRDLCGETLRGEGRQRLPKCAGLAGQAPSDSD